MFKDFGFKLVVIDGLLGKETSFGKALEELKASTEDAYEWGTYTCIPEMVRFVEELEPTDADLAQVTSLTFDGGNRIYFYLMPDWDGESDEFDVKSVEDCALLPNLKEVEYIAMCDEALMDELRSKGIAVL